MANLSIIGSPSTTNNNLIVNYSTDISDITNIEISNNGSNYISATVFSNSSATFDVSSWKNGTYNSCTLRVTYGKNGEETQLIINNIGNITQTEGNSFYINYSTNKAVTKHEVSWDGGSTFYDKTEDVTSSGNNYSFHHDDKSSVGTYKMAIRVTTSGGETVTSNIFTLTITSGMSVDTYYTVNYHLHNATSSNSTTSIKKGSSYSTTVAPESGYRITKVYCVMNGDDISDSTVNGNNVYINNVIGEVHISVYTEAISGGDTDTYYAVKYRLNNANSSNSVTSVKKGSSYSTTISPENGYTVTEIYCVMGGENVSDSVISSNNINIPNVTGEIVISVYTKAISETLTISNIANITQTTKTEFYIEYSTNIAVAKHEVSWDGGNTFYDKTEDVVVNGTSYKFKHDNKASVGTYKMAIRVTTASGVTKTSNVFTVTLVDNSSSDTEYATSCTSDYILDKMYPMPQNHEALPSGVTDTWATQSRWENQQRPTAIAHNCGQAGCPGAVEFRALGAWANVYRVKDSGFSANTGVEMRNIKVYGWYNGQWEKVQDLAVPNGNFYAESFSGDSNTYFSDSIKTTSTSKTIILREANKINNENCMYHPFSDIKNFDTKYEYVYTCIDLRKVKWDESSTDDRDSSHYCANCGGDWWLAEGLTFDSSWQHNKGIAQPKMIEITKEWRRFSMTTVPQNWTNGFPTKNNNDNQLAFTQYKRLNEGVITDTTDGTYYTTLNYINVTAGKSYTLNLNKANYVCVCYYNSSNSYVSFAEGNTDDWSNKALSYTFTVPANITKMLICATGDANTSITATLKENSSSGTDTSGLLDSTGAYVIDDFSGSSVNLNKWGYELGYVRNGETQKYTNTNAEINNGILALRGLKASDGSWTSASIISKGHFAFMYGKIVARVRACNYNGAFGAFWTLGDSFEFGYKENSNPDTLGEWWAYCGEFDVMEFYNGKLTCGTFFNEKEESGRVWYNNYPTGDWHEFAMEWNTDGSLIFSIDGNELSRTSATDNRAFHIPHFILLNQAIGASGGTPDSNTTEITQYVDWVKYYPLSTDNLVENSSNFYLEATDFNDSSHNCVVRPKFNDNCINKSITWQSSNSSLVSCHSGLCASYSGANGEVVITGTSHSGVSKKITLTVSNGILRAKDSGGTTPSQTIGNMTYGKGINQSTHVITDNAECWATVKAVTVEKGATYTLQMDGTWVWGYAFDDSDNYVSELFTSNGNNNYTYTFTAPTTKIRYGCYDPSKALSYCNLTKTSSGTTTLTISNISNITQSEKTEFYIEYSTNIAVAKHEVSWDGGNTFYDKTEDVTANGTNYKFKHDNSGNAGTYKMAIRVTDSDGNTKTSNVFTVTLTSTSTPEPTTPTPIYELADTVFDGSSKYVDTGVKPFKTASNYTIFIDFDDYGASQGQQPYLFHCAYENADGDGLKVYYNNEDNHYYIIGNRQNASDGTYESSWTLVGGKNNKIAIAISKGVVGQIVINGSAVAVTKNAYDMNDYSLILGAYQDVECNKSKYWKGTIHTFKVWNSAFTVAQLKELCNSSSGGGSNPGGGDSGSSDAYRPGRTLIWEDDFTGTTLNTANWDYENNYSRPNEVQNYVGGTNNVWVENSNLVIKAKRESSNGKEWSSGCIHTDNKREFMYGRFEAKIKIPQTVGSFPAFWTLGGNYEEGGGITWPYCGEIDIMEHKYGYAWTTAGALYRTDLVWDNWDAKDLGRVDSGNIGSFDDYHIYAMEWTYNKIDYYVDDRLIGHSDISDDSTWFMFHQPHYILLNQALGAAGGSVPSDMTEYTMYVDWVRVYAPEEAPSGGGTTNKIWFEDTSARHMNKWSKLGLILKFNESWNNKVVTWKSSNPDIATVCGGRVDSKGTAGSCIITATTLEGNSASITVNVE